MQCKSCNEDIPSKFKTAISRNECPICDGEIVDPKLQLALNDLKSAIDAANEFPEQLADWLSANYSFRKFDPNAEPKHNFNGMPPKKVSVNRIDEDDENDDSNQVDNRTPFHVRAGVKANHKKIISQIQGAADPSEFKGQDSEYENADQYVEDAPPLDQRGKHEIHSLFPVDTRMEQALELEKVKQYRKQFAGDTGKINRGD